MKPSSLLPQPKTSTSPPQLTTHSSEMDVVDPQRISQLSRRKLRGGPAEGSDTRKDRHNLRRLVLIQNSLVSISPCPSPSSSRGPSSSTLDLALSLESASSPADECSGCVVVNDEFAAGPSSSSSPAASAQYEYEDDGFGYVFPEMSIYGHGQSDDDDEDEDADDEYGNSSFNADAESDWFEAVLADLDDESAQPSNEDDEYIDEQDSVLVPLGVGGPRYPLPRPQLQILDGELPLPSSSASSPGEDGAATPDEAAADHELALDSSDEAIDPLPYLDADDANSSTYSDSDESSEPATPLSHSLLLGRSGLPPFTSALPFASPRSYLNTPSHSHSHHHFHHHVLLHRRHGYHDDVEDRDPEDGFGDDAEDRNNSSSASVVPVSVSVSAAAASLAAAAEGHGIDISHIPKTAQQQHFRALSPTRASEVQGQGNGNGRSEQQRYIAHDYFSCNLTRRSFDSY